MMQMSAQAELLTQQVLNPKSNKVHVCSYVPGKAFET